MINAHKDVITLTPQEVHFILAAKNAKLKETCSEK